MAIRKTSILLAIAWLFAISASCLAQSQNDITEEAVKAAFLHRFIGFVEWPAHSGAKDRVVIGVLNADEITAELNRYVAAKRSPISIRRIDSLQDLSGVHVLFIGARENARLAKIIAAVSHFPVLIVTEAPDGLDQGGMINFVTTDRVQFEVAVGNAARAGIHLNARLLSVAIRVRKGGREEFQWESAVAVLAPARRRGEPQALAG